MTPLRRLRPRRDRQPRHARHRARGRTRVLNSERRRTRSTSRTPSSERGLLGAREGLSLLGGLRRVRGVRVVALLMNRERGRAEATSIALVPLAGRCLLALANALELLSRRNHGERAFGSPPAKSQADSMKGLKKRPETSSQKQGSGDRGPPLPAAKTRSVVQLWRMVMFAV